MILVFYILIALMAICMLASVMISIILSNNNIDLNILYWFSSIDDFHDLAKKNNKGSYLWLFYIYWTSFILALIGFITWVLYIIFVL